MNATGVVFADDMGCSREHETRSTRLVFSPPMRLIDPGVVGGCLTGATRPLWPMVGNQRYASASDRPTASGPLRVRALPPVMIVSCRGRVSKRHGVGDGDPGGRGDLRSDRDH